MAAPNTTFNSLSNRLMRPEARHPVFGRFNILSSIGASPTAPGQDSGDWESPSEAVWNCDFYDRFV
jgi:hypothetical protein